MNKRVIVLAAILALAAQGIRLLTGPKKEVAVEDNETEIAPIKSVKKAARNLASSILPERSRSEGPAFAMSERNENNFEAGKVADNAFGENEKPSPAGAASVGYEPMEQPRNFQPIRNPSSTSPSSNGGKTADTKTDNLPAGTMMMAGAPSNIPTNGLFNGPSANTTPTENTPDESPSTPNANVFSCNANVGSGMFRDPIQVTLSCSNASNVRYCLAEGACCDPESGATYSSPVPVGQDAKTYCLSFIGEDTAGTFSSVVQKTYTFNPGLPDLLTQTQKYFQTTELNAKLSMDSDDIGKDGHSFGLINTLGTDPSTTAFNTCEQIVTQQGSFTPTPIEAVPETTIPFSATPSQIDMFLGLTKLQYGSNWLTTYIKNTTFNDETFYSCVTNEVVLEDFLYFQSDVAFAGPGNNSIREFAGGFTSLGFFEPEATVFRGPASGESATVSSNQELKTGLFGIFY